MTLLYDTSTAYNDDFTYFGIGNGVLPVLKVEMDLSSTFPTEVLDIDYGGVLAYNTKTEYDSEDRYDGFVIFDDITSSVRSVDITRGKSSMMYDHFDAGTCGLEIADFNSTFLPDEPASPYFPNVKPLRQVRVSAAWSGETFVLFRGYVDNWNIRWEPKQQYTAVSVQATDATKLLANFDTEVTGADGDTVAQRIQLMLTDKNWPADFTDLDTSAYFATLVEDVPDRRPLLPNLQEYETAEQGALFISSEGKVTWRAQELAYPPNDTPEQYIFSDTGLSPYVITTAIDYEVSDQAVYNTVSVTPTAGTEQVRTSSSSIDQYRERALILTDVPLMTDTQADQLAAFILNRQGVPLARITSVATDPRLTVHSAGVSLRGELLTRVNVVRTPPGGTTADYKMFIIGVRHSITPETWRTDFITDYAINRFVLSP